MPSTKLFGLPPVPPELKVISPYLQRADELKSKDPVMTYWCLYYAAQTGLSLKPPSPALLFALLTVLENMKNEIGPNDAVDMQAASIAYVENFALKVFSAADEEDRKGLGNRSTAKKFLAAANFLEVLKIFPNEDIPESNEEKIRYAKWKAADIAKAFREGRKPTPGPADSEFEIVEPPPPVSSSPPGTSPTKPPSPSKRVTPPPHMNPVDITRANLLHTPPSRPRHGHGDDTPGNWSTVATPGSPIGPGEFGTPTFEGKGFAMEQDTPSGKGKGTSRLRNAFVSDDDSEEGSTPPGNGGLLFPPKKTVTFTPSVVGGLSSTGSPPPSPTLDPLPDPAEGVNLGTASQYELGAAHHGFPPGFIPPPPNIKSLVNHAYLGQTISPFSLSPHILPQDSSPQAPPPPPPPHPTSTNLIPGIPNPAAPSHPAFLPHPNPPRHPSPPPPSVQIHQPPPPPVAVELSPTLIAKTQKHCRFAISALDYEDAEQARKELRAALALLGG